MTYVQGFVKALAVISCFCWGIFCLAKLDKNAAGERKWKQVQRVTLVPWILLESVFVAVLCSDGSFSDGGLFRSIFSVAREDWAENGADRMYLLRVLLLGIAAACLLAACVMDVETHLIYDYVWWISGAAALLLLVFSGNCKTVWRDVLCFILLQQLLFGKMYGRADCHAFSVCAIIEGAFAMKMQDYLMHMLIAFCILAAVQLVRGNVGRGGNLKAPIPFLPYIALSFWSLLLAKFFVHIYAFRIAFSLTK